MFDQIILAEVVASIFWCFMGLGLLITSFLILDFITHFSIKEEVAENKNMAVAILVGMTGIALAILISSVIK